MSTLADTVALDANISIASEANAPALDDIEAQVAFFKANSYVVLPGLFSPELVASLNEAIDRDREENEFLWWFRGSPNNASNLLLTQPVFDHTTRLPVVLNLLHRLMGGPVTFEELSVQVSEPGEGAPTGWHRDTHYGESHPLHLEYPQLIAYLTDVDETTHCFTVSPEPAEGPILEQDAHIARGGIHYLHGKAGTAIFFNSATVHGLTRRDTENQRRILQIYFGHLGHPELSQVTIVPPRLWRDHPDAETRRFFSKQSRYSRLMHEGMGISLPDSGTATNAAKG